MATREHYVSEIEAIQKKKALLEAEQESNDDDAEVAPTGRALVGEGGSYDQEIYGGTNSKFAGYVTSIAPNEQV